MIYIGRFAPSPTGPLHAGSLLTAVASYLDARSHNGHWLVRIEDLDPPREVPGASSNILHTLEQFGFEWHGEVVYQSTRSDIYQQALNQLNKQQLIYHCGCSRSEIHAQANETPYGMRYSGTCRDGLPTGKHPRSIRVKCPEQLFFIDDKIQRRHAQNLHKDIGDFVVRRADMQYAYQLAVVVDDALQQVSHIVRGSDLLTSTPRQLFLQQALGYSQPGYAHIPVIVNSDGEKLSKQTFAKPVELTSKVKTLCAMLEYLNQDPPADLQHADLDSVWQWAIQHWQIEKVAHQMNLQEASE